MSRRGALLALAPGSRAGRARAAGAGRWGRL